MALVAFSTSRPGPHDDLHPFERLAVRLSSRFSSIQADDVDDAVGRALEDIGTTFGVDECTLIALDPARPARVVRSWAASPSAPCTDDDLGRMPWLVQRLARNSAAVLTPMADVPRAAAEDRVHAERTGVAGRLGVPIAIGPRVGYGLVAGSRQRHVEWRVPVVERLRLVGEILGGGLARVHRGAAPPCADPVRGHAGDGCAPEDAPAECATDIIGESAPLRLALARLNHVAPVDATVLLLGETGTGKELFARALHERSPRRRQRLVRLNCAALPATLIESELFGHERGAFTGAVAARQGRFELADGGTLFLDEIGDLSPELQAKLLRVLQEGEFERVGSSQTRRVDVRVVAATHVDLDAAVEAGRFRADLYYRLSVFPIALPPLRERADDIPQLVWHFIRRRQRSLARQIRSVPAAVLQLLQQHDWPGNVRELENVIERAMIRSTGSVLELDLPLRAARRAGGGAPAACGDTLDAVQRHHIERVLRECGWRINGANNAAVRLGLHPNTLRFRIKKLGVALPDRRPGAASQPSPGRPR
jgi:transcriptional regulator with GAF, ATPase, and Fis domain